MEVGRRATPAAVPQVLALQVVVRLVPGGQVPVVPAVRALVVPGGQGRAVQAVQAVPGGRARVVPAARVLVVQVAVVRVLVAPGEPVGRGGPSDECCGI